MIELIENFGISELLLLFKLRGRRPSGAKIRNRATSNETHRRTMTDGQHWIKSVRAGTECGRRQFLEFGGGRGTRKRPKTRRRTHRQNGDGRGALYSGFASPPGQPPQLAHPNELRVPGPKRAQPYLAACANLAGSRRDSLPRASPRVFKNAHDWES